MKKSVLLSTLCMAAAFICAPVITSLAATAYPSNWEVSSEDASYCYLSSDAHDGSYSFAHAMDSAYSAATWQEVNKLSDGTYTLTAYVKSSGGQKNCWLSVKDYGGKEKRGYIEFSDEWTEIKIEDIHVTTGKAVISVWTESDKQAWALVDDVSFTDSNGKNYVINGNFEKISEKSVAMDAKPDTEPPTKVVTRFFEKWTLYAEPTADVAYTTTGGHTGKYCGVHYSKVADYSVSTIQTLAGLPEGKYGGSVWVKSSGGQKSSTLVIAVDGKKYNEVIPATNRWVKVEISDVPVTGGTLDISVWSDSPAGCWLKYDDMAVYNMNNVSKNLLQNSSFETLGTPPDEQTGENVGAEGAGGGEAIKEDDESIEIVGGMEMSEEEDFKYDESLLSEEEKDFDVDILLIAGMTVIVICFALSIVTFIMLMKKKKDTTEAISPEHKEEA